MYDPENFLNYDNLFLSLINCREVYEYAKKTAFRKVVRDVKKGKNNIMKSNKYFYDVVIFGIKIYLWPKYQKYYDVKCSWYNIASVETRKKIAADMLHYYNDEIRDMLHYYNDEIREMINNG